MYGFVSIYYRRLDVQICLSGLLIRCRAYMQHVGCGLGIRRVALVNNPHGPTVLPCCDYWYLTYNLVVFGELVSVGFLALKYQLSVS